MCSTPVACCCRDFLAAMLQVQRHTAAFDLPSALMLVWSRARLHGVGLTPEAPFTSALVSILARHVPSMSLEELQVVQRSLDTVYLRRTGRPLQQLLAAIAARQMAASAGGLH